MLKSWVLATLATPNFLVGLCPLLVENPATATYCSGSSVIEALCCFTVYTGKSQRSVETSQCVKLTPSFLAGKVPHLVPGRRILYISLDLFGLSGYTTGGWPKPLALLNWSMPRTETELFITFQTDSITDHLNNYSCLNPGLPIEIYCPQCVNAWNPRKGLRSRTLTSRPRPLS